MGAETARMIKLGSVEMEVDIRGDGPPLLLLTGEEQLEHDSEFLTRLAKDYQVIIPSPPGFGHTQRPDWLTRAEDIAWIYLDLADHLKLKDTVVVGCSLGGWLAAETAVADDSFIGKLVLVNAYGVKIGGPYDCDIQDMWINTTEQVNAWMWTDPSRANRDFTKMTEDELTVIVRNRENFARLCWEPYMHNPKLKYRLHRIGAPTLVVWGEKDGLMSTDYGKGYADLIPGAKFVTIPNAAHYPHLENTDAFMAVFEKFAG